MFTEAWWRGAVQDALFDLEEDGEIRADPRTKPADCE